MTMVGIAGSASDEARAGSGMLLTPPNLTLTLYADAQAKEK
jgi:hypothetical protein